MQNKLLPVLVAATLFTCGARAQQTVVSPTTPAPVVQEQATTPAPDAQQPPASAPVAAPQAMLQTAPTPNQVIYAPRLPSPAELTNVANAQGQTIEQINQTSNQVTVIYKNSFGQLHTVAYQLLPTNPAPATTVSAPTTVVVPAPAPTVIYESAPRTIYYDTYEPYWRPRYYYNPPVSLSFGFGFGSGWGHHHRSWGHGHYRHRRW